MRYMTNIHEGNGGGIKQHKYHKPSALGAASTDMTAQNIPFRMAVGAAAALT